MRAVVLAALALLVVAAPARAQDSFLERQIAALVPGLRVEGLRGVLSARPGFARATLADAQGVWLEVEDVALAWAPTALFRRQAHLTQLDIARITILRAPIGHTPASAAPPTLLPSLPSLPVALRLDAFRVQRIELAAALVGEAVAPAAAGALRLDGDGLDLRLDGTLIGLVGIGWEWQWGR